MGKQTHLDVRFSCFKVLEITIQKPVTAPPKCTISCLSCALSDPSTGAALLVLRTSSGAPQPGLPSLSPPSSSSCPRIRSCQFTLSIHLYPRSPSHSNSVWLCTPYATCKRWHGCALHIVPSSRTPDRFYPPIPLSTAPSSRSCFVQGYVPSDTRVLTMSCSRPCVRHLFQAPSVWGRDVSLALAIPTDARLTIISDAWSQPPQSAMDTPTYHRDRFVEKGDLRVRLTLVVETVFLGLGFIDPVPLVNPTSLSIVPGGPLAQSIRSSTISRDPVSLRTLVVMAPGWDQLLTLYAHHFLVAFSHSPVRFDPAHSTFPVGISWFFPIAVPICSIVPLVVIDLRGRLVHDREATKRGWNHAKLSDRAPFLGSGRLVVWTTNERESKALQRHLEGRGWNLRDGNLSVVAKVIP